jgi:REP element-mobilizing transposase RayT
MTEPMLARLKIIMKELCEKWQCEYTEGNGDPDPFHLVFRYYTQLQLSKLIDNDKSVSSRRLNQEYDEYLKCKRFFIGHGNHKKHIDTTKQRCSLGCKAE